MVLTTFKRIALISVLCVCSCVLSMAQGREDSSWYYTNNLTDYATADLVCLVRVGATKIVDTTGGYSVQEVTFEPLKYYKGKAGQRKFRAWLESHEVVWKPGTIRGFYLLKGEADAKSKARPGTEMYYWLENSGFTAADTPFITAISDTGNFKNSVAQYILPDISGNWAKVKLVGLTGGNSEAYGAREATIRVEQDLPALELRSGQVIPVTIWKDPYMRPEELIARFQEQGIWDVVLYKDQGQLQLRTEFMLKQ